MYGAMSVFNRRELVKRKLVLDRTMAVAKAEAWVGETVRASVNFSVRSPALSGLVDLIHDSVGCLSGATLRRR